MFRIYMAANQSKSHIHLALGMKSKLGTTTSFHMDVHIYVISEMCKLML